MLWFYGVFFFFFCKPLLYSKISDPFVNTCILEKKNIFQVLLCKKAPKLCGYNLIKQTRK